MSTIASNTQACVAVVMVWTVATTRLILLGRRCSRVSGVVLLAVVDQRRRIVVSVDEDQGFDGAVSSDGGQDAVAQYGSTFTTGVSLPLHHLTPMLDYRSIDSSDNPNL